MFWTWTPKKNKQSSLQVCWYIDMKCHSDMLYWFSHVRYHAISTGLSLKGEICLSFFHFSSQICWRRLLSCMGGCLSQVWVVSQPSSNKYCTFSSCRHGPASTHWCADYSIYFKTPPSHISHISTHAHVSQHVQCPFLCRWQRLKGLVFRSTAWKCYGVS